MTWRTLKNRIFYYLYECWVVLRNKHYKITPYNIFMKNGTYMVRLHKMKFTSEWMGAQCRERQRFYGEDLR